MEFADSPSSQYLDTCFQEGKVSDLRNPQDSSFQRDKLCSLYFGMSQSLANMCLQDMGTELVWKFTQDRNNQGGRSTLVDFLLRSSCQQDMLNRQCLL